MNKEKPAAYQRLMVVVMDRLSDLIDKGEITDRYYNPGDLFKEVHIIICNEDQPDLAKLQKTVGTAKLHIHNINMPRKLLLKSLGFQRSFLKSITSQGIEIARAIKPQLIRCHGTHLNTLICAEIKRVLGIPFLVSMHINPDEDLYGRAQSMVQTIRNTLMRKVVVSSLKETNLAMPVYSPIVPFLEKNGIHQYEVCYNVINPANLRPKTDYSCGKVFKIVSVGRQIKEKNPDKIIHAIKDIPGVEYTLVGNGPYHQHLKNVVEELNMQDRVHFIPAIPNDELCKILPTFDLFATHTEYWEISKSVLEALLTGLPILLNRRIGEPVQELESGICHLVENEVEAYKQAITTFIQDDTFRENLGKNALAKAQEKWLPENTEKKFVSLYQKYALQAA